MSYVLLVIIVTVLIFAWATRKKQKAVSAQQLVYRKGDNPHPDSDADMQEQYDHPKSR
jgi:hypothetical protein